MKKMLQNKRAYSTLALVLVLVGEGVALAGIRGYVDGWLCWVAVVVLLIVALLVVGRLSGQKFVPRSVIMTKLLANAIAPRLLGVIYLLFFVVHIGWLTNAAMSLFMPADSLADVLVNITVCVVAMLLLIVFFPDGNEKKGADARRVFVSGISAMLSAPPSYEKLNLRPLVRTMQLMDKSGADLLILKSDFYQEGDSKQAQTMESIMRLVNPKGCQRLRGCPTVEDKLRLMIKEVFKREFPTRWAWLKTMNIAFTEACNYNDFPTCYNTLSRWVKRLDDRGCSLCFNLTPGTGIVGSLMTLMAIDGDRTLYYYSQDNSKAISDEERLREVDKSQLPLENLLSQALEKLDK